MSILQQILNTEWDMFHSVNNTGGQASCQTNADVFKAMRYAQWAAMTEEINKSYLNDLHMAKKQGRNLMTEKYAHMMFYTHNDEYQRLVSQLPNIEEATRAVIKQITELNQQQEEEFVKSYPNLKKQGRAVDAPHAKYASTQIYFESELLTYSIETLQQIYQHMLSLTNKNSSLVEEIHKCMIKLYGFTSLDEAEQEITKALNKIRH